MILILAQCHGISALFYFLYFSVDSASGKVDETAYNKLKAQLESFQEELAQNEVDSNLLREQLQQKNVELDGLTEELNASRELRAELDVLHQSKRQLANQLETSQSDVRAMEVSFESERDVFRQTKAALEEERDGFQAAAQQYETIMDSMKLSNEQMKAEVESLRETIRSLQSKDRSKQQQRDRKNNTAKEILSKYFTVAATEEMNEKQLRDTETKIQSLSQEIVTVTKAYEAFTGKTPDDVIDGVDTMNGMDDGNDSVESGRQKLNSRASRGSEVAEDGNSSENAVNVPIAPKPKKLKRKRSSKASSSLSDRMAMFGGGVTPRKRRKSKHHQKIKEFTDSMVQSDPKKNMVFQTERLTHYLNSAMGTIEKERKQHHEEMETKLNGKEMMIAEISAENDDLKRKLESMKDKDSEIAALQKRIDDLLMEQQSALLTANMGKMDSEDEEDEMFEQIKYLQSVGKGTMDDIEAVDTPEYEGIVMRSEHRGYDDRNGHEPSQLNGGGPNGMGFPIQIASWRQQLDVGSKLDCLDEGCLWWTSTVPDADLRRIKVRYDGFGSRWDEWVDRSSTRIAPHMTKAKGGRESKGVSVNLKVVGKRKDKRTGRVRKIYKQGFLVKQGKRFKSYKTRYFILMEDGQMEYFKKMTDHTPVGSFSIKNMLETRRIAYPNKKDLYGFEIVTTDRTWRFQAHSDDVVADWIGVIHAVSKGMEPGDEEQLPVVYSGFGDHSGDELMVQSMQPIGSNSMSTTRANRRATAQAASMQAVHRPNGFGHRHQLSIQETPSSHPPINRAGFSQIMVSPLSDGGIEESVSTNNAGDPIVSSPANGHWHGTQTSTSYSNNSSTTYSSHRPLSPSAGAMPPQPLPTQRTTSQLSVSLSASTPKSPSNNKSRPELVSPDPRSDGDCEFKEMSDNDGEDGRRQHSGWMYKAGKWDGNWTHRFCVLTADPVQLQCFVAPDKKQTHCIDFKEVRSCIELKRNSDKYLLLEIPTSYAFQLVTMQRIYTFACESRHDLNIWLKKIRRDVEVHPHDGASLSKMGKRSSIVKIGTEVRKFTTGLGRLIGVTQEHVTTTEVLKTENVQIHTWDHGHGNGLKPLDEWKSLNIQSMNIPGMHRNRRRSMPAIPTNWRRSNDSIAWPKPKRQRGSRRKSAPDLWNLKQIAAMKEMSHSLGTLPVDETETDFGGKRRETERVEMNNGSKHRNSLHAVKRLDVNANIAAVLEDVNDENQQNIENEHRNHDDESLSDID